MDASHLYSSRVYPPKPPERASAADSFVSFLDPVALLAVHPVSYWPTSNLPRDSTTPRRFPAGGTANCIPRKGARQTVCESAVPDSNWTLGQGMPGLVAVHENTEGIRAKCKAGC